MSEEEHDFLLFCGCSNKMFLEPFYSDELLICKCHTRAMGNIILPSPSLMLNLNFRIKLCHSTKLQLV